jgi:hypothetical protein
LRQGGFDIVPAGVVIASQLVIQIDTVKARENSARNGMPKPPLPQRSCA